MIGRSDESITDSILKVLAALIKHHVEYLIVGVLPWLCMDIFAGRIILVLLFPTFALFHIRENYLYLSDKLSATLPTVYEPRHADDPKENKEKYRQF